MATPAENAIWEARARIMWGENPTQVARWLRDQDVPETLVDDTIRNCLKERAIEVRRRGIHQTFVGVAAIALALGAYFTMLSTGVVHSRIFVIVLLAGMYGLWQASSGLMLLFSGGSARGSVGDMGSDI
jgi:hypothetical protein